MNKTLVTALGGAALVVSMATCGSASSAPQHLSNRESSLVYGTDTPSTQASPAASPTPVNPTIAVSCKMENGPANSENNNKPAW
jgi:hypothetical protein